MELREHKTRRTNGALENVDIAEKALKVRKEGDNLDTMFAEKRAELKKSH
jgi:hypothetical protein